MNGDSNAGEAENKPIPSSNGLPSEKSNQGDSSDQVDQIDGVALSTPAASSPPAPPPPASVEAEA